MTERRATTAIELVVVIALLLVAASASFMLVSWSPVGQEARAISRRIALIRSTAILTGVTSPCLGPVQLGSLTTATPPRGLRFTSDGLPRACDGGGVGNTTILLAQRGRQAAVIVSSLGRVRWELR